MNRQILTAVTRRAARHPAGPAGVTDRELLRRFVETHDDTAFAELVNRFGPMVWTVCRQLLPNHADAEDGVQATFLALVRSAKSIRKRTNTGVWLYGVAVRVAAKLKRTAARRKTREGRVAVPEATRPTSEAAWAGMYQVVHDEVQRLPESLRTAFLLCEWQGVRPQDAAKQLGCTENAVSLRLSKARRRLVDRLAERGIAPAVAAGLVGFGATAVSAVLPPSLFETVASLPRVGSPALPTFLQRIASEAVPMKFATTRLLLASILALGGVGLGLGFIGHRPADANEPGLPAAPPVATPATAPVTECSVTGTILQQNGSPAANAIVWACQHSYSPLIRKEVQADKDGKYELKLAPGDWFLWARFGTQGAEATPNRKRQLTLDGTIESARVDVRLQEQGTFKGQLFEAETKKPIVGGKLYLDCGVVLVTDANGRFELGGLLRKNHESFVVAPGRMRQRVLFDTTAKAVTELDVPVPAGGKIVGRVLDLQGQPIRGAWVGRSTSGSYFSINGLYQYCADNGTFEYDDAVAPDQQTRLTAYAPGYQPNESDRLVASPGNPANVEFRLIPEPAKNSTAVAAGQTPRRVVSGIVRGPDSKPAPGVLVRWGYQPYAGAIDTRTDANGFYKLTVPDEENYLAILPRQFLASFPRVTDKGNVTVNESLLEGHSASGIVVDDVGKPIPNVNVVALQGSPDPRIGNPFWLTEAGGFTDADGRFELKGVPEGARFDFMKSALSEQRNQVLNLDGAPNKITLQFGGAVKGRVVDLDGKPVRNFRVTLAFPRARQAGDAQSGFFAGYSGMGVHFTSDDGTFVLAGVGAGSVYRIQAYADGHGEAVVDRVKAVPINHLEKADAAVIKADAPTQLRLTVSSADGKPVPEARVTLVDGDEGLDRMFSWGYHDSSWENMVRGRTNAKGVSEFPSLSFAGATVLVRAPGMARYRIGWRDKAKDLVVTLRPEAILAGEIILPAGGWPNGFYVSLTSQVPGNTDSISIPVSADQKGKFRIPELAAGKWSVSVRDAGTSNRTANAVIELQEGQTKDWQLEWGR